MKKSRFTPMALCLCVLCCALAPAACASETVATRIFDDTDVMLVGGKNILDSTGPEIYAALGAPESREFLYYEGATGDGMVAWHYDGMDCLPPSAVLSSEWPAQEGIPSFDVVLSLSYIDPAFYTEIAPQNGWTPADHVYYTHYICNVYFLNGTVVAYTLYRGALAE